MRIKKIDYILENEKSVIHLNENEKYFNDNNTYTLLLGENGTGKSKLLENIMIYYSGKNSLVMHMEFENQIEPTNLIYSTYTPFDRLRINKEFRYSNNGIRKNIYYPSRNHNDLINLTCISYLKCRLINHSRFKKIANVLNKTMNFNILDGELLIESINHIGYESLGRKAHSTSKIMKKEYISKIQLRKKELLSYFKNFTSFIEENYFLEELVDEIINKNRFPIFYNESGDSKTELMILLSIINAKLDDKDFEKIISFIRKSDIYYDIELYLISITIKLDYIELKQNYGHLKNYKNKNKMFLKLEDILYFFEKKYNLDRSIEFINNDIEILEFLNIKMIDDLLFEGNFETKVLTMFSSGEFSLFTRIFEINLYINKHSLILIDEPEVHLNPKWINDFYYILRSCFQNLECHFIIASQSPFIVKMMTKEQVYIFKRKNNSVKIENINFATFNAKYDAIVNRLFNLSNYNSEIKEKMNLIERNLNSSEDANEFMENLKVLNSMAGSYEKYALVDNVINIEKLNELEELIKNEEKRRK
ncbi:hypothetical protein ERX37_00190 [Macrococcus hajekii]|uniref:ATPase AAA-type core domain-containing protein n=1 Tax=Macrococcus hajekii TaxID=198482 RepID=A0A4R6BLH0_9STAP|nr:AAA family ATPase [Macrococcus hajekii]TDM02551.1 hypothetical protein ERX37_00190 [Macrococcus hajekii]GGB01873.1 hypothetical protein GCM10007190_07340 [Macrococcus hajekii]